MAAVAANIARQLRQVHRQRFIERPQRIKQSQFHCAPSVMLFPDKQMPSSASCGRIVPIACSISLSSISHSCANSLAAERKDNPLSDADWQARTMAYTSSEISCEAPVSAFIIRKHGLGSKNAAEPSL